MQMVERRQLTKDERSAADALRAAIAASGLAYEAVAARLGVSAGAVGHWASGSLVVPLDRVGHLSSILGVAPSAISVRWREQVSPYIPATSQPARYDPAILADAMALLDAMDQIQGRRIELRPDPARLAIACEVVAAGGVEDAGPSVVVRLAERLRQQGEKHGLDTRTPSGVGAATGGIAGTQGDANPARRRAQ